MSTYFYTYIYYRIWFYLEQNVYTGVQRQHDTCLTPVKLLFWCCYTYSFTVSDVGCSCWSLGKFDWLFPWLKYVCSNSDINAVHLKLNTHQHSISLLVTLKWVFNGRCVSSATAIHSITNFDEKNGWVHVWLWEIKPATAIHSTAFFNKKNSIFHYEKWRSPCLAMGNQIA